MGEVISLMKVVEPTGLFFLDEKLLEKRDLFLWSKVISAQW